ncbi:uncharacterized protein LODBEIA_P10270 [Lodderomyces beijingensis]|uniref:SAM-dependent MTase RsmB/NOP-type domain-containing protein n=1 Tax=Lodderomyces beijingensis TaxID=1775926 RepID=A0ABP0ZF70_9ASCO
MKLYFEAEKFLRQDGKPGSGSLQSRIFSERGLKSSPKHVFALVHSTSKFKDHINHIIKKSKVKQELATKKVRVSDELLALLVHDLLFSPRGRIESGKHPIKDAFLSNKTRLQAEFIKLKLKYKIKTVDQLPTKDSSANETPVRWFRINTIKIDPERFFKKHPFFTKLQPVNSFQELTAPGLVYSDDYIPHLYGIHPREKLSATDAYKLGEVIIQDRASCFPAHILNQDPHDVHKYVIDACSAPGNKTTHAASYLPHTADDGDGVVYAIERDAKRVAILRTMTEKATGRNKKKKIQVSHRDFTTIKPEDYPDVTGLIVDPSCSGSGIFGRAADNDAPGGGDGGEEEEAKDPQIDQERLKKLASFQFIIMKHALSFPSARKVVYSTCSIHAEENERVVVDLLSDPQVEKQGWTLASKDEVIPTWPRRGIESEFIKLSRDAKVCRNLADGCVRANPREDGGIGFFAACFVKRDHVQDGKSDDQE